MPTQLTSGYVQMNDAEHRKQYEHRYIWERAYGEIPIGYEIHHINGIKDDNRLENLELLTKAEHVQRHPVSEQSKEKHGDVFRELWRMGILKPRRNEEHGRWHVLPLLLLLRLYDKGKSPNKIAKILKVDKSNIQKGLNLYRGCNYALH